MEYVELFLDMVNNALDTKRKRHIVGGILMSVSLFFGGLSITVISIKKEENEYE